LKDMSLWEKIYFISAWVVAGCLGLALILYAVALRHNGLLAFATVCDAIFMGITGCFALLYLSKWFRHSLVLFIMAWVVAGLALLALILSAAAGQGGTYTVGTLFWHIGFGGFCTLLLLHLSDWFTKAKSG
jgi:hypothetical protein